mgnify:CR=1 FL=1
MNYLLGKKSLAGIVGGKRLTKLILAILLLISPLINQSTPQPEPQNEAIFTCYAYCPCTYCCGKSNGITATGTQAKAGRTIAVDPKIIPLGSTVIINGREYIAEDTGGGIRGYKVDIFFWRIEKQRAVPINGSCVSA